MKKKLLAVAVLSAFANAAFADVSYQAVAGVLYQRGAYVAVSAGTPTGVDVGTSTLDASTSYSVMVGYQVNKNFSIEGGPTSLYNQTNLTFSAATTAAYTTAGQTASSKMTLAGAEAAGVFCFPINEMFSPFIRIGTANMTSTSDATVNAVTATTNTSLAGPTYGAGAQFNLSKLLSARIGYNSYSLKDNTGATSTPKNAYLALVFRF
jgi:opacity protein-like surface antigen